ncbi:pirin family protein [bacterium]|nr:pirin family protein [bacterium]
MSRFQVEDPDCQANDCSGIEQVIVPRTGDIGNFEVKRALPSKQRRMVGPFIFLDQMGPGEFITGQGVDVRPHPHIGLSTVTYLLSGTLDHRDSLGFYQRIKPGEVNLMTAGSGVVHSERIGQDVREKPSDLFGMQSWIALPKSEEERESSFNNYTKESLPCLEDEGKIVRLICGNLYGMSSPVKTFSDTLYADISMESGATLPVPKIVEERALYALQGELEIAGTSYEAGQLLILRPGDEISVKARTKLRVMLLGGAPLEGPRHVWWNFVSSSKERIEEAKRQWREGLFPNVPLETEFIPLPEV